jgi:hypothetical protein
VIGIGTTLCWRQRQRTLARVLLAVVVAGTALWAFVLLDRSPDWLPALRVIVLAAGLAAALAVVGLHRLPRPAQLSVAACGIAACLAGPLAYTVDTVRTSQTGSIPSAGPTVAGAFGGPGGAFAGAGGGPGTFRGGAASGRGGFGAGSTSAGSGPGPAGSSRPAAPAGSNGGSAPTGGFGFAGGRGSGAGFSGGGGTSAAGGLLSSSKPGAALVKLLESDASRYSWVAATVGANSAAGYQLATDDPVMAIGGFNGTDPAPTLAEFEKDVSEHKIHWFIAGGLGGGGLTGSQSSSSDASAITSFVESHFSSRTVDGVTVYNLSTASAG